MPVSLLSEVKPSNVGARPAKVEVYSAKIRRPAIEDVLQVEVDGWENPNFRAPIEKLISRLNTSPEGFFGAYLENNLTGILSSQVVHYEPGTTKKSWEAMTDNGYLKKSHDPKGNSRQLVSLTVSKKYQGYGLGHACVRALQELAVEEKREYVVMGTPLVVDGYEHKSIDEIMEYVNSRKPNGKLADDKLRFYESCNFMIDKVVPRFMGNTYPGVIMYWKCDSQKSI